MSNNKVIWITGSSRGIGLAIAKELISENNILILSASKYHSFAEALPEFKLNKNIYYFPFDLKDADSVFDTYEKIIMKTGKIDVLINNAGIGHFAPFSSLSIDEFDNMMNVNFRGQFLVTKSVIPGMIKRNEGMIININSVASIKTFSNSSIYSATKSAALVMSRSLREEVRSSGIKIIDILPGATATGIWDSDFLEKFSGNMIQPSELAKVINNLITLNENNGIMTEEIIIKPQNGDL